MQVYEAKTAFENVLKGAQAIYDPVKTTLGPKGRNVLIRDKFGKTVITHDGVTVARSMNFKDDPRSIGADVIKEATTKMDEVGDGTTSVTVLTYHLIQEAKKLIDAGANPMIIKRRLEAQLPAILAMIKDKSQTINRTPKEILPVATVSAGSEKLGKLVADLIAELGYDSTITVETSQTLDVTTKVTPGFVFESGYMSQYFTSDGKEAKLQEVAIIVTKGTISDINEYESVFKVLVENKVKQCLVVADNVDPDALSTFIMNKLNGNMNFCVVRAPGYGDNKQTQLEDLCAITGARMIDPSIENWKDSISVETIGAASQVISNKDETVIIGAVGTNLKPYLDGMKKELEAAKPEEKQPLQDRIAKLEGKVGVIKVGGVTPAEAEEAKYRIDDAVAAVKAALYSGIVAGGGVTLRDIGVSLNGSKDNVKQMLADCLQKPYQILLENSGLKVENDFNPGFGVNVLNGKPIDMVKSGIIDPTQVTTEVVRNAVSTANLAITIGGAVIDEQLSQEEMMKMIGQ